MPLPDRPTAPTAERVEQDHERARAELAKLGVEWKVPLEERVYAALLELPPTLQRACKRGDLVARLKENDATISEALARLKAAGRVISPTRGEWVALT